MPPPGWQRWTGGVLVSLGAVQAAVLEALYVPLRIGRVVLPVSVLAAIVLNAFLPRLMYAATGSRPTAALPIIAWLAVVIVLALPRPEGDVVMPGTWVGLAMLFLGAAAAAWGVSRVMSLPAG